MHRCWLGGLVAFLMGSMMLRSQETSQAPVARQIEHISIWHGEKVNDPFFWLREKSNPEVIRYLEAENAYTKAATKGIQPFADSLYKKCSATSSRPTWTFPFARGEYLYYSRMEEGKQYPIRCRKTAAADGSFGGEAAEEVLLDANELAKGLKFFSVGQLRGQRRRQPARLHGGYDRLPAVPAVRQGPADRSHPAR